MGKACELCNNQASLYCPSDSAFLCGDCDAAVHAANFLVARHFRRRICAKCNRFTGIYIAGATFPSTCTACSPEKDLSDDGDSLPSSSTCVSSSESCATKKIKATRTAAGKKRRRSFSSSVTDDASQEAKRQRENVGSVEQEQEEVFAKWSREIGLGLGLGETGNRVASHALSVCLGKWNLLPFRVAAATSFWLGLRFCGDRSLATWQNLARLEKISGVPAKLILAAHANLARVFTLPRELHEGWGES
ncbi:B-box zinc finger protein 32 [Vigna unguiculata]|uniref:Zinc finger protein CONSTANS n=1 Tax=Vigna unguiculata TaxID=3917 RepID=A0A4D6MMJ0_VIGUN|nr:B-box zinc finger protein 32 [Vigna unguiculata]QCE00985.1 zinc finger protein CONSTANS [Vigna unguiculata]